MTPAEVKRAIRAAGFRQPHWTITVEAPTSPPHSAVACWRVWIERGDDVVFASGKTPGLFLDDLARLAQNRARAFEESATEWRAYSNAMNGVKP